MSWRRRIIEASSLWIDHVATAILALRDSWRPAPFLRLVEQQDGSFALQRTSPKSELDLPSELIRIADGRIDAAVSAKLAAAFARARVELVLQDHRFIFRPLELPRRASDFLEGIVRAQIDRLTPWSAADAAFGWRPATEDANDRMVVTVAATARKLIAPFVSAIASLGADTIIVSAPLQNAASASASIKVFEQKVKGALEAHRMRRALIGVIVTIGLLCGASVMSAIIIGGDLEARRDELTHRIAERRAALRPGLDATSEAGLALERRKHETPSSVIVIEALSQILPDHTYLTELRILDDKMQIVGVTHDPPLLIHLIEQSPHFTSATFFAPTTQSPSESGEHFFIEAHIRPVYAPTQLTGQ